MKWIISANTKIYNHFQAFKDRGVIDWRMNKTKFEVNDIVYIYSSRPLMQLSFKCLVVGTNIDKKDMINDDEYWIDKEQQSNSSSFMRLVLLDTYDDSKLSLNKLREYGLKSAPQGPVKLGSKPELDKYICEVEKSHRSLDGFDNLDSNIASKKIITGKVAEVIRRVGQNIFKEKLLVKYGQKCLLCGVEGKELLIVSHIKEWSECLEGEHLDDKNGLLLCPNHDKLFDKHLISFTDEGQIIISNELNLQNRKLLNVKKFMRIDASKIDLGYLEYHRKKLK